MSFTKVPKDRKPKHVRMVEAIKPIDEQEAVALWNLFTDDSVSAEQVSLAVREEMPKYTGEKELQSISARQILRIRKGLLG